MWLIYIVLINFLQLRLIYCDVYQTIIFSSYVIASIYFYMRFRVTWHPLLPPLGIYFFWCMIGSEGKKAWLFISWCMSCLSLRIIHVAMHTTCNYRDTYENISHSAYSTHLLNYKFASVIVPMATEMVLILQLNIIVLSTFSHTVLWCHKKFWLKSMQIWRNILSIVNPHICTK